MPPRKQLHGLSDETQSSVRLREPNKNFLILPVSKDATKFSIAGTVERDRSNGSFNIISRKMFGWTGPAEKSILIPESFARPSPLRICTKELYTARNIYTVMRHELFIVQYRCTILLLCHKILPGTSVPHSQKYKKEPRRRSVISRGAVDRRRRCTETPTRIMRGRSRRNGSRNEVNQVQQRSKTFSPDSFSS